MIDEEIVRSFDSLYDDISGQDFVEKPLLAHCTKIQTLEKIASFQRGLIFESSVHE
jgi:hypothetical protein